MTTDYTTYQEGPNISHLKKRSKIEKCARLLQAFYGCHSVYTYDSETSPTVETSGAMNHTIHAGVIRLASEEDQGF